MVVGQQWQAAAAAAAMVALVAVVQVQRSVQLRPGHPLRGVVDRINRRGGPYVGLVMTFPLEEAALQASGEFVPSPRFPPVQLAGRRFNIGTIRGVNVIYVMTGEQTVNAAVTTQILYDVFDIVGVVHYGIAGSSNDSLLIGDVSVPSYFAFSSSWDWQEFGSSEEGAVLNFGAYNVPRKGSNLLGEIEFKPVQLYSDSQGARMESVFWLPVDPNWFDIATQLKDTVLLRCLNETDCLPEAPKASFGLRGSTADVYLNNGAYRCFLLEKFNISSVDEESAAIVMTSLSNGKPCIVFRGISDFAGGRDAVKVPMPMSVASLAATNALNLAVVFIELIGNYNGSAVSR